MNQLIVGGIIVVLAVWLIYSLRRTWRHAHAGDCSDCGVMEEFDYRMPKTRRKKKTATMNYKRPVIMNGHVISTDAKAAAERRKRVERIRRMAEKKSGH